mgnify:CR=1 FL=1
MRLFTYNLKKILRLICCVNKKPFISQIARADFALKSLEHLYPHYELINNTWKSNSNQWRESKVFP